MSETGVIIESDGNEEMAKMLTNSRIQFSKEVREAMDKVLQSEDAMDAPDFNVVDYINQLFPNEQSLVSIDETIQRMQCEVSLIDENIRTVVRGQTSTGQDGQMALSEAQKVISALYTHITDVKSRAERTEEMVKEITRDIKQLDCAKRNLTSAITTLNHLHMLVGGIESLNALIQKRAYGEILNPLQAITEVNEHFQHYADIQEIKQLSQSVDHIQLTLAQQITSDFKQAFSPKIGGDKQQVARLGLHQLGDACKVVSVLDAKVKKELLKWFIEQQLEEYLQLFHENQDIAWLDKIDKRYAWLKRHLLDFENKFGAVFPLDWEVSERITVEFCRLTREQLSTIMAKRVSEIDVRLLLFAINKTQAFEQLLSKRFSGVTLGAATPTPAANLTLSISTDTLDSVGTGQLLPIGVFHNLIGSCFKAHLDIYIRSVDRNLAELMEKFVEMSKEPLKVAETQSTVYPSSADLFVFYKKCMVQCNQLSNEQPMYDLALVFKKYLREYASKVLESSIPKLINTSTSIGKSMVMLTRDMQNLSTAAGQVFQNLLKEGESQRFSQDDLQRICCVLTTAEYCLETVQQLEEKLKEKISSVYSNKIDMSEEKDVFHRIISNCIQMLVHDLEAGCELSLQAMAKIQWQNISNVGDQSSFISSICANFKHTVPIIRDNLATSRKYFTQFCHKFVNSFIPKYINVLYKCKLMLSDGSNNVLGCEQLLLDTHSLKTALLDLPSVGSSVNRKAPTSYTKVVVKDMTRAEMIIKVVMTPVQPANHFTQQVLKLLPDITIAEYQKILDMKAVKRVDQLQLIDIFKRTASTAAATGLMEGDVAGGASGGGTDTTELETENQQLNESNESTNTASSSANDNVEAATPKRAFIFSVGSFTAGSADKAANTPSGSGDRGRIRKLENLLKKRLP